MHQLERAQFGGVSTMICCAIGPAIAESIDRVLSDRVTGALSLLYGPCVLESRERLGRRTAPSASAEGPPRRRPAEGCARQICRAFAALASVRTRRALGLLSMCMVRV